MEQAADLSVDPPMRRRRSRTQRLSTAAAAQASALLLHPRRAAAFAAVGLLLGWLVLTRSFPYVVAETSPELALWLDPHQPVAALTLADRARAKLLKLIPLDPEVTASVSQSAA